MTVIEVTETEIFQFHTVFDDRRDSTDWRQMTYVWTTIACTLAATLPDDLYLLWQIFVGCNFMTVRAVTKITKITRYTVLLCNHVALIFEFMTSEVTDL